MSAPAIRHALIVKLGAIGDVVMAIPAAHQLHQSGWQVDWVCGAAVLPLLQLYPWITPIVADERAILKGSSMARLKALTKLWRTIGAHSASGGRYALCATLYYDARYRLLTLPVRAARRLELSHEDRELRLLPGRHHTDEYARILLGRPDGLAPEALAPVPATGLPPSPLARTSQPRVVLAPAGARNLMADDALRRWPAENYVALAEALLQQGVDVVLIGGRDDTWVQPLFAGLALTDLIAQLSLLETLALLDAADVTVTHDTGPLHLAGITRTGIVTIFGPTDPRGRLPQRAGTVALWGGEGFACRPCYDGRTYAPCAANDCMRQVTSAMVAAEVMAMLAERAQAYRAPPRVASPVSTVASLSLLPREVNL